MFATFLITNDQPRLLYPRVKRNPTNALLMLLRRDRHIRRRGQEEKSERFGNVSENLRGQVGLSQQPHSPFPFADERINVLRAKVIYLSPCSLLSSQIHHFLPPAPSCHPGAVLSSECYMWHFIYFLTRNPKAISKSNVIFCRRWVSFQAPVIDVTESRWVRLGSVSRKVR